MTERFKRGGFEKRLLVFFLLLSVTPTLLIAIFGTRYFAGYVERLSNVALRESFRNSMEIAREYSARLNRDAATMSRRILTEYRRQQTRPGTTIASSLQATAEKNDADFVGLYVLEASGWRLAASYPHNMARLDTMLTLDMVPPGPGPQRTVFSDQDIIASSIKMSGDSILAGGYLLEPGRTEMMRKTGEDYSRYSSVGLYVSIIRRYSLFVIGALVVVMAVASAIASRLLARRISYPIQELAHATDRIAKGDLDHRVSVKARDEIQSLVTSFNNMTRDLQEYKTNLIRAERIAAWREVARRIAHDIKNPLTPITVAIYRLKKRLDTNREDSQVVEECLDSILREVEVLKTMAEEFSTFAKLPEPRLTETDLNQTVQSVLELYASGFQNMDVRTAYEDGLPHVLADGDQLRRVIGNIIKNAAEAMNGEGSLTVRTYALGAASGERDGMIRIEISDTGPGIPEEMRERIFDPYFTTKKRGTGLGLAMAYRIIQDHGGKISLSTGPRGTTFCVDLRAAAGRTEGST
jgi:nitrogen fixation/metabolism regulation signal transduction histidine kinase